MVIGHTCKRSTTLVCDKQHAQPSGPPLTFQALSPDVDETDDSPCNPHGSALGPVI